MASSPNFPPILEPGRNCWRIEHADRLSVIVDAADYFHLIREAMEQARERILIIGWDFDTRIILEPDKPNNGETLGHFFLRLAKQNPKRRIDILKWSFGAYKQFVRPRAAWMLLRWQLTKAIDFRFDSAHPVGCSHHQKIVVIDDCLSVCGGIDISGGRWDTREHRDDDPARRWPAGPKAPPWHDATTLATGPIAGALAELGRERWKTATGTALEAIADGPICWPDDAEPQFRNVELGIARTRAEYGDLSEIREVEALYLDMIAAAHDFIYIENQYFTSAKIAAAIATRMAEDDPPEIVMVMARSADGWLERRAMDAARVRIASAIGKADHLNRFRIYVPVTAGGTDIYVHAKIAIVDDRLLRIGSSNLNNRSLGLDSECDLVLDAALPANADTPEAIRTLRIGLIAEHLDVSSEQYAKAFEEHGSMIAAIEALRGPGKTLDLLDLTPPDAIDSFIADNELLDPDEADGYFEPLHKRGLRRSWRKGLRWRPKWRPKWKARWRPRWGRRRNQPPKPPLPGEGDRFP